MPPSQHINYSLQYLTTEPVIIVVAIITETVAIVALWVER